MGKDILDPISQCLGFHGKKTNKKTYVMLNIERFHYHTLNYSEISTELAAWTCISSYEPAAIKPLKLSDQS